MISESFVAKSNKIIIFLVREFEEREVRYGLNDHTLLFIGVRVGKESWESSKEMKWTNKWRPLVKKRESDISHCDTCQMRVLENQHCRSVRGDQVSIVWGPSQSKGQSHHATSSHNTSSTKLRKIVKNSSGLRKIHRKIWRTRSDLYFLFLKRKIEFYRFEKSGYYNLESEIILYFYLKKKKNTYN